MGKTAAGAVWLAAEKRAPFEYWQFWRNAEDADVGRFLRLFTDLPLEEIARLEALEGAGINEAKKVLATEATALCHGRAAAEAAAETARRLFEEGTSAESLPGSGVPKAEPGAGIPAVALFLRGRGAGGHLGRPPRRRHPSLGGARASPAGPPRAIRALTFPAGHRTSPE